MAGHDAPDLTLDPSPERQRRDLAELAAARRELVKAVTQQYDWYLSLWSLPPEEAEAKTRQALAVDHARPWQGADQVGWSDLEHELRADPERGQALWQAVKADAREELATGSRAARTLERPVSSRPYERAQFFAVLNALATALRPRDAVEELLVQQMAVAFELPLRWQALAVQRVEESVWEGERDRRRAWEDLSPAQRERHGRHEGWLPPRQGTAEAMEQAAVIADRAVLSSALRMVPSAATAVYE